MPIIWTGEVVGELVGEAAATNAAMQVQGAIASALSLAGYAIAEGYAYWFGDAPPPSPYGIALSFCDDSGDPKSQDE